MAYRHDDRLDLAKLKQHELLAFGALMRALLSAGGYQTPEMRSQVEQVAEHDNPELFWDALHQARDHYQAEQIEQLADEVLRPAARELIFVLLNEVAEIGSLSLGEASLIEWLQGRWDITVETLPDE